MMSAAVMVAAVAVMVLMMGAFVLRIKIQRPVQQGFYRGIRIAAHPGIQGDPRRLQGHFGAAADTAANQYVHFIIMEQLRQCAVTAAIGVQDALIDDAILLNVIHFELFAMAKMLKNLAVFIGYRNTHMDSPYPSFCLSGPFLHIGYTFRSCV